MRQPTTNPKMPSDKAPIGRGIFTHPLKQQLIEHK